MSLLGTGKDTVPKQLALDFNDIFVVCPIYPSQRLSIWRRSRAAGKTSRVTGKTSRVAGKCRGSRVKLSGYIYIYFYSRAPYVRKGSS